ncbi:hypothetical protein Plhal304r1_c011g0044641 [Plasmopara halstedii]
MSPNTTEANAILCEDNYFVWEFNAWIKIAKKGLLEHVDTTKAPSEDGAAASEWRTNVMKAFAILSMMVILTINISDCTIDCLSVGDFEDFFPSSKHPQSNPDASSTAWFQDEKEWKCNGSLSQV